MTEPVPRFVDSRQITEWADRSFWPKAQQQGTPLPVADLISKALAAQPEAKPSAITFYSDPEAPAMVATQPSQNVFVNRYTGAATVGGSAAVRAFFRSATDLHRYLAMSGENRATGRAITGASNLAFLFIVCSGIYLWFPRNWTLQAVKAIMWFKPGLKGRPRDFNWHNTFGFWTAIPLFFIVLSGVVMSYPWANSLVYRIAGSPEPVRNTGQRGVEGRGREGRGRERREGGIREPNRDGVLDLAGLDVLVASAEQRSPGWRTINLRLPSKADKQVTFSIDKSFGGRPQMRSTWYSTNLAETWHAHRLSPMKRLASEHGRGCVSHTQVSFTASQVRPLPALPQLPVPCWSSQDYLWLCDAS